MGSCTSQISEETVRFFVPLQKNREELKKRRKKKKKTLHNFHRSDEIEDALEVPVPRSSAVSEIFPSGILRLSGQRERVARFSNETEIVVDDDGERMRLSPSLVFLVTDLSTSSQFPII